MRLLEQIIKKQFGTKHHSNERTLNIFDSDVPIFSILFLESVTGHVL